MAAVHVFHYHAAVLLLSGNPDINPTIPLDYRGASILRRWDIIYSLCIAIKIKQTKKKITFTEVTQVL